MRYANLIAAFTLSSLALAGCSAQNPEASADHELIKRAPDSAVGAKLFVEKGCVTCHAVNGVGGKAGPALDAQTAIDPIDPLDFAARMWRGAPAMVELQSLELGYVIWLSADEITHLAAFAADADEQKKLTLAAIPNDTRDSFLDERFWEVEDWDEFLRQGQEGFGEPPADEPVGSGDQ